MRSRAWTSSRPGHCLAGCILVTRTRQQASELTLGLEALGAEVIEAPTIQVVPAGFLGLRWTG